MGQVMTCGALRHVAYAGCRVQRLTAYSYRPMHTTLGRVFPTFAVKGLALDTIPMRDYYLRLDNDNVAPVSRTTSISHHDLYRPSTDECGSCCLPFEHPFQFGMRKRLKNYTW